MTVLMKDLIDLPEHVHQGDFVLRLTEGVTRPDETLRDYVVTPQLVRCFEDALSFIQGAVQSRVSKAGYLHGSFGSGKSHFMAVLHLILEHNVHARSIAELASVIAKHNAWTTGKKFLLVPYHMIGARNMESGILGGYVDFIRRVHPNAPTPGVYLAEGLFEDAKGLRESMGDAPFFARLNENTVDTEWGELEAPWDAARFEKALAARPGAEERTQLVARLVASYFRAYHHVATGKEEAYVPLDQGLSVISKHAADLGYDALILFLDELILWLASFAATLDFMHREGQKLAKLVEAQTADRPIPIVSFVARQRDLSELVGDNITGADKLNFSDALRHWEGRFHKITLEDRNLPAIAEKRILKPKDEAARQQIDTAFEQTAKIREETLNTLLTSKYDRDIFRKVYPFSPALVDTLVGVSSVLQRERTALKVMLLLLVHHRETLSLGDIVPVGDLFDVVAHGDEAFSQEMAIHFDNAKRLYHEKLLPLLEKQHGVRCEVLEQLPYHDMKRTAFRSDDRLIKTLLLAALVPGVESLKALNANRLAALNHGSIKTPVPGTEGREVLRRCKAWAAEVGQIKIGDESANPSISVQLTGVDVESIIEQARREDNQGNRIRRVRQMLFEQLGIEDREDFSPTHDFFWRGTKRACSIIFNNIRNLPDASLQADGEDWQLLIDFPFDEPGHGPRDDLSRMEAFREKHPDGSRTLAWIPSFFSTDAQKDLGTVVILEHILTGERFGAYSAHLSPQDRPAAKAILENQRGQLRQRVLNHLEAAYGLDQLSPASVDTSHELSEHFASLEPGFDPQPPVASNLAWAMDHLLHQALEFQFPAHPCFEAEIKALHLKKVYEEIHKATQTDDGRVPIEKNLRTLLRQIANPLLLGEMGADATHFVLGQHWKNHFQKKATESGHTITVKQLREWIDQPKLMGLPKEVQNLLVLLFAEQTNRTFYQHNVPVEVTLTSISDQLELREWRGPEAQQWSKAVQRAASIFGLAPSPLLNAGNVTSLATHVKEQAVQDRQPCRTLNQRLRDRMTRIGLSAGDTPRQKSATATLTLVERLSSCVDNQVVPSLANADIATSESAMGTSRAKATELAECIEATNWEIFEAIGKLADGRQTAAAAIRKQVVTALESDEHVITLAPALKDAQSKAVRLLTDAPKPPSTSVLPPESVPDRGPSVTPPPKPLQKKTIDEGVKENLPIEQAKQLLTELQRKVGPKQDLRLNIGWRIEEGGTES
jgi:hypothetical protein